MNERLKQVRKAMNKTQKDFGGMLGVRRDTYASYETGRVIPNDTFIQLLCSKFNVNEEWLRSGTGEMLIRTQETILDELVTAHSLTKKETAIVSAFLDLSPAGRSAIIEYIEKVANEFYAEQIIIQTSVNTPIEKTIPNNDTCLVWSAARSTDNSSKTGFTEISKKDLESLHNAPTIKSDDDL